ncbi:MAG: helix-turn-helix domain-containing protein [Zoogloeaceae bacterium]|jgi:putative transcriptional regulator|nr:helix-turn-helix domain-containing protein [Zoogloeaceae bacterium]
MKLSDLKNLDVEATARAIEADAGHALPDIRLALSEAKAGVGGRVTTPEQILMRQARKTAGLSQSEFARAINTPVATLRDWEQGRFPPPGTATVLARLITKHPQWTKELVGA